MKIKQVNKAEKGAVALSSLSIVRRPRFRCQNIKFQSVISPKLSHSPFRAYYPHLLFRKFKFYAVFTE